MTTSEDYVSFEIAKLLKEKGFDGECRMIYREHDMQMIYHTPKPNDLLDFTTNRKKIEKHSKKNHCEYCLCPTIQMALKWLREVHKIHIDVFIGSDESYDADGVMDDEWHFWTYYITNTSGDMIYDAYNEVNVIEYQSHEEAVEAALKYALENLI